MASTLCDVLSLDELSLIGHMESKKTYYCLLKHVSILKKSNYYIWLYCLRSVLVLFLMALATPSFSSDLKCLTLKSCTLSKSSLFKVFFLTCSGL
jgi:hypothetical protein